MRATVQKEGCFLYGTTVGMLIMTKNCLKPQGLKQRKKGADKNYFVTTTMTATSFFPESFKAPLDPGL